MTFKYIDFQMKPSLYEPIVYYVTEYQEGTNKRLSMTYSKFKTFLLNEFKINDIGFVLHELDSHNFVHVDNTTGEAESVSLYANSKPANFNKLLEINTKQDESKLDSIFGKWKELKNRIF